MYVYVYIFHLGVCYISIPHNIYGCYMFNFTLSLYEESVVQPQVDLVSIVIFNYSSLYMVYLPYVINHCLLSDERTICYQYVLNMFLIRF
jgi:hypothetical protein